MADFNVILHYLTAVHIANGMYGLILVEPEGGLPRVDKEFYVVQGDIYADDSSSDMPLMLNMQACIDEKPSHVVFNGRVGSLLEQGSFGNFANWFKVNALFRSFACKCGRKSKDLFWKCWSQFGILIPYHWKHLRHSIQRWGLNQVITISFNIENLMIDQISVHLQGEFKQHWFQQEVLL
jgi:hypothetical protein